MSALSRAQYSQLKTAYRGKYASNADAISISDFLYIVVCQDKIEKTNFIEPSSSDLNGSQNGSRLVSDISISQIAKTESNKRSSVKHKPCGNIRNNNSRQCFLKFCHCAHYTEKQMQVVCSAVRCEVNGIQEFYISVCE